MLLPNDNVSIGDVVGQAAGMSFLSASTALLGKSVLGRFDLANAAYKSSGAPAGWTRLNDQQISVLGLNPNHFRSTGSNDVGFKAYLFRSNDDQLVLAFRGSRPTWGGRGDWENDLKQEFGRESDYYRQAITLAREVSVQTDGKFELVGHSLGGGMAAAAAIVTGAHATTFNAAGVNVQTVQPYHKTLEDASKPISGGRHLVDSYIVRGEILDEVQRAPGLQKLVDFISPFPADWLHTVSTDIARATGLNPEPAAGATHYLHDPHPLSGGLSLQTLFGAPDVSHAVSLHGTDAVYAALLNDHIA